MKNKRLWTKGLVIFLFACLLFGCTKAPTDVVDEITEANKAFMGAFNNADAKAVAENYTTNARLMPSNSDVIVGQEAIAGFWQAVMNSGIKKGELETVTAEGFGNIAIEEGKYKLFVEGDQLADQGKYIVTWKKEGGKWKLHQDIWNTSNPAPKLRAALNDTTWLILNHIKADKREQFEQLVHEIIWPIALKSDNPLDQQAGKTRILHPVDKNKDGTYTYVFLMDPLIQDASYSWKYYLEQAYDKEKAQEYLDMAYECGAAPQKIYVLTQSKH